jgi:hypothetical protein
MKKKLSLVLGVAAFAAVAAIPLNADPVGICVGYNGGSCSQVASGNGSANYSTTTNADYSLLVAAGSGTPSNPEPTLALTNLATTSTSTTATQLTVELTETNLTMPVSPGTFIQSMAATLGPGISHITFANYIDSTDTAYGMGTTIGTYSTTTSGATATNSSGPVTYHTPFSETEVINIYFTGNGQSAQAQDMITSAVPEPVSLGLLGSGLAALGIFRWRKSRKA